MTNTHITVGGHKVTTNKVGSVHTVTTFADSRVSGNVNWIVINGICYVTAELKSTATANNIQALTTMPKAKITGYGTGYNNRGLTYVAQDTNILQLDALQANQAAYCSFSYPVADDWVES